MKSLAAGLLLATLVGATAGVRQEADPLAAMRRAVGDEAALARVLSFDVTGNSKSVFGGTSSEVRYEVHCRLADQFITTTLQVMNVGPLGSGTMVNRHGFDRDTLIAEVSNDLGLPSPPAIFHAGPQPKTTAEIDADLQRRIMGHRERMVHFTLPMFGASFAGAELTFKSAGETAAGGRQYAVDVTDWDGDIKRLFIDQVTHLPARLKWMAPPPVTGTFTSTSTVATRGGQIVNRGDDPVRTLTGPAAPPAGLVEHEITFDDFKADAGFTWPHRFITKAAGEVTQDLKLGKFKIKSKS